MQPREQNSGIPHDLRLTSRQSRFHDVLTFEKIDLGFMRTMRQGSDTELNQCFIPKPAGDRKGEK